MKNLLRESVFLQKTYRRYVQPHLPQYEPETYILRGMKFDQSVDVGAHAGTYSILLSHNSERVFAFEPTAHSFDILRSLNIENLIAYNLALGDEDREMEISVPTVGGNIDYALATLRPVGADEYEKVERQKVRVVKFDDFEREIDFTRIDFVKIDVEGFELKVLLGMRRLLELKRTALLIEIEQRHNPKYAEVFDCLSALRYRPYVTPNGVFLQPFSIGELPALQSRERLLADEARKFRLGERKMYINNFFFLQAAHKPLYHVG
ncbi:MAG TPA: FkbM family methyltransferase [Xanthobacteraceae bacterium]|nr:FkbM family methyltransferase [Xanthobacteraceae bacterium]